MSERELIVGKVAAVLNERKVVINKGSDDGVTHRARFKVVEEVEIVDPDTHEILGATPREVIRTI